MNITQVKESCLYVSDLDRTENFYSGLLGFPVIVKAKGRHIFFRVGTNVLLCFIAETTKEESELIPHFATGKQHIAFETPAEDYLKVRNNLEEKGIKILLDHQWKEGVQSFYFNDPDGHVLEVVPSGMWD